jgi:Predicted transcriptional regulator
MQLKKITDQAFRCVLYLSGCQRPRSSETISKEAFVPEQNVKKIMSTLCKRGIVCRFYGKNSGYALAVSPEKIFPYDIVVLFEESCCVNRCLEEDKYCDRNGPESGCPVRLFLSDIQQQMNYQLKAVSFLELYEQTDAYKEKSAKQITL